MSRRAQYLAAAEAIAGEWPAAAACLRRAAASAEGRSPGRVRLQMRRRVLRRIKDEHFGPMHRTAAARVIAAAWRAWAEGGEHEDLPGSLGEAFARLRRAGVGPACHRTIVDDLDEDLHPADPD